MKFKVNWRKLIQNKIRITIHITLSLSYKIVWSFLIKKPLNNQPLRQWNYSSHKCPNSLYRMSLKTGIPRLNGSLLSQSQSHYGYSTCHIVQSLTLPRRKLLESTDLVLSLWHPTHLLGHKKYSTNMFAPEKWCQSYMAELPITLSFPNLSADKPTKCELHIC